MGSVAEKPITDADQLSLSFSRLQAALEQAHSYVESVVVSSTAFQANNRSQFETPKSNASLEQLRMDNEKDRCNFEGLKITYPLRALSYRLPLLAIPVELCMQQQEGFSILLLKHHIVPY